MAHYRVTDSSGALHIIEGPDNATPDEIIQRAQDLIPESPSNTEGSLSSAVQGALSTMANPNKAGGELLVNYAKNNPRMILPMIGATALATGGATAPLAAGFLPALGETAAAAGLAGLGGAGGEAANQLIQRARGQEDLSPQEALMKMASTGGVMAATEGLGRLPGLALKGMGSEVRGAVKRAVSSDPYEASKILSIAEQNPEVTKPGYFKDRIIPFVDDVIGKLKQLKSNSQKLVQFALQKVGKKVVGPVDSVASALDDRLSELRLLSDTPEVKNAAQQIANRLGTIVKQGRNVTAQDIIDLETETYQLTSGMDPKYGRAFAGFSKDLEGFLDKPQFKELQAARQIAKAHHETESVIKQTLNLDPKTDLTDVNQLDAAEKKVSKFLTHGESSQEGISQAFKPLGNNLEERAKKLAAAGAGSGRLSAEGKGAPSIGPGQASSLARSPERAAFGIPTVRALAGLESPTMVGNYFRALKAAEPHKLIGDLLMPGLIRSALLAKKQDENQ